MELHRPPLQLDIDLVEYLDRQFKTIEAEINNIRGVRVLKTFPNKPRIGTIYSIEGELFYNDGLEWFKITALPYIP